MDQRPVASFLFEQQGEKKVRRSRLILNGSLITWFGGEKLANIPEVDGKMGGN